MRTARPQVPHVLAPTLDLGVRRGDISWANVTLERITKDILAPCEQHCREGMVVWAGCQAQLHAARY